MESQYLTKLLPYLRHKYFSNGVAGLLLVLVCYQLAAITWMLMPAGEPKTTNWQPNSSTVTQAPQASLGIVELLNMHIFGAPEIKNDRPVRQAPTKATATPLNVQLSGIVASSEQASSLAIIENRGQQETYGIGETIEGTQAKILEILSDRVIVDNRGQTEFIVLDGVELAQQEQIAEESPKPKALNKQDIKDRVAELKKDPGKLTDYLRISPVREDGVMKGYRINPGKEQLLFTEFDLKANDLAVAFNGFDLKDSSQAMEVMKELSNLTEASITVERDGQLHDVFIQLP